MRRTQECPYCYEPVVVDDDMWLNGTPELQKHMKQCGMVPENRNVARLKEGASDDAQL